MILLRSLIFHNNNSSALLLGRYLTQNKELSRSSTVHTLCPRFLRRWTSSFLLSVFIFMPLQAAEKKTFNAWNSMSQWLNVSLLSNSRNKCSWVNFIVYDTLKSHEIFMELVENGSWEINITRKYYLEQSKYTARFYLFCAD